MFFTIFMIGGALLVAVAIIYAAYAHAPLLVNCPYCGGLGNYWIEGRHLVCPECEGKGRFDIAP